MKKNFKNLFSEEVQGLITEDTLNAIEEAFNEKVQLSVDSALLEQDEIYATKLQHLLGELDKDRSKKLVRLVEAIDKKNASQLVKMVRLYERQNKTLAKGFQANVVKTISGYLDEYLTESLSKFDFPQAVKNQSAYRVLENLRRTLAVDATLMKESVKTAIVDGKDKMTKLETENAELKTQLRGLQESNQKIQVSMLLESKTAKLPDSKKNFLKKALGDKSVEFINENFDYTLRLFEKQEKSKLDGLKDEALKNRQVQPDVVPTPKVVEEKVNKNVDDKTDMYLQELKKSKGQR